MREGISKIIDSKSKTFLAFCFCFVTGAGIFSVLELEKYWQFRLYLLLFVVVFLLIIFWNKKAWRFVCFGVLFFILGGIRFLLSVPNLDNPNQISFYNGERKEIVGTIISEPEVKESGVKYIVSVIASPQGEAIPRDQEIASSSRREVGTPRNDMGRLLVSLPLYPRYDFGDKLRLQCNLGAPRVSADSNFRYDNYLARQGIFSVCNSPVILNSDESRSEESSSRSSLGMTWIKRFLSLKFIINERVEKLWPEPQSSLMAGLLYGARSGFSSELSDNFSRVGISHIVAISGYNISIVATVLLTILISLGFYRRQAFYLCVLGIILFVIFTGASASVVRAGIMGVVVLIASQLGRLSRVGNVLAFTAALMLLFNPYVLVWDAGFQLSFLATVGIVYLSPVVGSVMLNLFWHLKKHIKILKKFQDDSFTSNAFFEILSTTFSAIIITLPLILFQFGRLSVVAPLANLLVLWIIPFLMLFGFVAVIASLVFFPLGQVVAWITGVGLGYVIMITNSLGGWWLSAVDLKVSFLTMVLMYLTIYFIYFYAKKNKSIQFSKRL